MPSSTRTHDREQPLFPTGPTLCINLIYTSVTGSESILPTRRRGPVISRGPVGQSVLRGCSSRATCPRRVVRPAQVWAPGVRWCSQQCRTGPSNEASTASCASACCSHQCDIVETARGDPSSKIRHPADAAHRGALHGVRRVGVPQRDVKERPGSVQQRSEVELVDTCPAGSMTSA